MSDTNNTGTVTVRLVSHGESTVTVDRAGFDAAVAAGTLDRFLDQHLVRVIPTELVIGPDHTAYDVNSTTGGRHVGRPSLLGQDVTAAVTALVAAALRPGFAAGTVEGLARAVAETLVAGVRQEDLIIMPVEDADAIIRAAHADATAGGAR